MPKKTPDQVAHANAEGLLASLLIRNGIEAESAHQQAQEYLRELTRDGWRHVRPRYDPTPPKGVPAAPDTAHRAAEWAREQIAARREQTHQPLAEDQEKTQ